MCVGESRSVPAGGVANVALVGEAEPESERVAMASSEIASTADIAVGVAVGTVTVTVGSEA